MSAPDGVVDPSMEGYGRFGGPLSVAELERCFFLDDADLARVRQRRGDRNRVGFALQLGTVRYLGTFLADPTDVPTGVIDYVAGQVGAPDPSCVKGYLGRRTTRFDHAAQITAAYGYREFAGVEAELARWIDDRAWTTGEGPTALFAGAVRWLRARRVLLPGRSRLDRLVGQVRDQATQRLYGDLAGRVTPEQVAYLEAWLDVADGAAVSNLDRLRSGPTVVSGKGLVAGLERAEEIAGAGWGTIALGAVPARRVVELARWGMAAKAPALRRHPYPRRVATLLATAVYLEAEAVDDALELFNVLMVNDLMARAQRDAKAETLRRYPRVAADAATCAAAVEVLLGSATWAEEVTVAALWAAIDTVVSRSDLAAAVAGITAVTPPAGSTAGGEWRAGLVERYSVVRRFLPVFCRVIEFGATADAAPILAALQGLPDLMAGRATKRVPVGYLDAEAIDPTVIPAGWWQPLVFPTDRPPGTVDRAAYVFCVLEQFHQRLGRRDIFAVASSRWADPRSRLLTGPAWDRARQPVLNALGLPDEPAEILASHTRQLDAAWRHVAATVGTETAVIIDDDGRLHAEKLDAVPDPASLTELRRQCEAMLPHVEIGEAILDVMSWLPAFGAAFTSASGGETRLDDLPVTIAAALTAHALNIGFTPVIAPALNALTRSRISHVDQNYLRPETYAGANAHLIAAQADIGLAQAWGGGLVAAVDGIRFVVPMRSIDARPNPKYFGRGRGATLLNLVTDHAVGIAAMVVSGTPRDSLHVIDLIYRQDGGTRPEVIISDTGSYSDMVFGMLQLLGFDYRPQLADLPDQKLWRIDLAADYGPLNTAARGKIDLTRVERHWPDILRIVGSIHTGALSAHDAIRMLAHHGQPTQLGDALAHYGRIFKTQHVLSYVDDEPYRRQIKAMRNLQEGRHALARHVFHGRHGELRQAYHDGMEDQLGALGLVLNCLTLWNTVYLDAALTHLRTTGHPVHHDDVARLSPYMRRHLNIHGHYSFHPPTPGTRRPLRNPDETPLP